MHNTSIRTTVVSYICNHNVKWHKIDVRDSLYKQNMLICLFSAFVLKKRKGTTNCSASICIVCRKRGQYIHIVRTWCGFPSKIRLIIDKCRRAILYSTLDVRRLINNYFMAWIFQNSVFCTTRKVHTVYHIKMNQL